MKNRILSVTRSVIPYVKELRSIAGSVTASILMQQLDYWFEKYPDGFYKFLEPCEHPAYSEGDSWTEELGFSKDEFRTAFASIGKSHKSKSQLKKAEDPFDGKFYCSYFDRSKGMVYYHRNHDLVDQVLNVLIDGSNPDISCKSATPISRNRQGQFTENGNPDLLIYTETTIRDYSETTFNQAHKAFIKTPREKNNPLDLGKSTNEEKKKQPQPDLTRQQVNNPDSEQAIEHASGVKNPHSDQDRYSAISPKKEKETKVAFKYDDYGVLQFPTAPKYKLPSILAMRSMQFLLAQQLECDFAVDSDGKIQIADPQLGYWMSEDEMFGGGSEGEQGHLPLKKMVSILNSETAASRLDIDWYNEAAKRYFHHWHSNCQRLGKDAAGLIRQKSVGLWLLELDPDFDIEFEDYEAA